MTMTYDLQSVVSPSFNLVGICQIRRFKNEDEIYLGDTLLGDILELPNHNPDTQEKSPLRYVFKSIMGNVYPSRNSYLECWFDVLLEIANDTDLAIELAIRAQAKKSSLVADPISPSCLVPRDETMSQTQTIGEPKSNDLVTPLDKGTPKDIF